MFGVGKINESGESLLSFCALNQLCVMNTMFEKKRIQQYTRQYQELALCVDATIPTLFLH